MRYKILCVGKIKDKFFRDEIQILCDKINKNGDSIEIIEIPDIKIPDKLKEDKKEVFLQKECEPMRSRIKNTDYVIALCIEGKEMDSKKHRSYIDKAVEMGKESISYVIGGSLGLPEWVKERADLKLSFSKMTFPHQMMRMVLLEEIERITAI